jgi:tRNA 2-thiouridine synthesizing protein C
MKSVLFLVRSAPYGSAGIPESVRSCLGFGAMPMNVSYVLLDDAVWALMPDQNPAAIHSTDVRKVLGGLEDLDVALYAGEASLADRGLTLEGATPTLAPITAAGIADLIATSDVVLTY